MTMADRAGADGAGIRLAAALPASGGTLVLTNSDAGGRVRSRPVSVWWDAADLASPAPVITVLTGHDARKADDLEHAPEVTLTGATPDGWFAAGGDVTVLRDPDAVAALLARLAPGIPSAGVAALRLTVREARQWTVRSGRPFDNDCTQLVGGSDGPDAP